MGLSLARTSTAIAFATGLGLFTACQDSSTRQAPVTTNTPQGTATAPPAEQAERADEALVRFVHANPSGAAMDLYADDTRAFDGVAFKTVTPYQPIDGQRYTLRLRRAGAASSEPLASNSEGLDDGDYYTVFALPGASAKEPAVLRVVEDDFSKPGDGKARVRVVNAAQDLDEIDVYASGRDDALFGGVDMSTVTSYDEIDPWSGALEVRAENSTQPIASVANANFEAGKVYTVVVVGHPRGTPKLEAFVIEDQMGVPATRTTTR